MTDAHRFCEQCGAPLGAGLAFCDQCGAARAPDVPPLSPSPRPGPTSPASVPPPEPVNQPAPSTPGASIPEPVAAAAPTPAPARSSAPVLVGVVSALAALVAVLVLGPRYLGGQLPLSIPGLPGAPSPSAVAAVPPTSVTQTSAPAVITPTRLPSTATSASAPSTPTPVPEATLVPATPTSVLTRPSVVPIPDGEKTRRALSTLDASFSALYLRDQPAYEATFNDAGRDTVMRSLWSARQQVQRFRVSLAQDPFPTPRFPFEVLVRVDFELTLSGQPMRSQGIVRLVADGSRYLIESVETVGSPDQPAVGPPWMLPSGGSFQRALTYADHMLKSWEKADRAGFDESFAERARATVGRDLWQMREQARSFRAYLALDDPMRSLGDAPGSGATTTRATIRALVEWTTADGRTERQTLDLKLYSEQMDFLIDGVERVSG